MTLTGERVPSRTPGELRTEVAARAVRLRRVRRVRLAAASATASMVAGLLLVIAVTGPVTDVRTTPASTGMDRIQEDSGPVDTVPEGARPAVDVLDGGVSVVDEATRPLMPPPTVLPRKPDAPASKAPLDKAKAKILFTRNSELYEAMVDGTGERRASSHVSYHVRWSPDGRRAVLVDGGNLVVVDLATDQRTVLIEGRTDDRPTTPTWMPDGTSIVYTRMHGSITSPDQELWLVDVATRATRRIRANPGRPTVGPDAPAVGPDGRILYVCPAQGTAMLCLTDIQGRDLGVVPGSVQFRHPQWSPDGKRIAATVFTGAPGAMSTGLVVQQLDGSDRRVLVPERVTTQIAWFPDSSRVAFTLIPPTADSAEEEARWRSEGYGDDCGAWPCLGDTGIWSITVNGSDPRPIVTGRDAYLQDARRA